MKVYAMTSQLRMTLRGFVCLFTSFSMLVILCLPNAPYTLASAIVGPTIVPPGVSITQWNSTASSLGAFILSAGVTIAFILLLIGIICAFLGLFHKNA
jgi:hypothetical protein